MKFIFGVLLAMIASAFAVNLKISSLTKQDADGFVTFSFLPTSSTLDRALHVEIVLPGDVNLYTFKNCFRLDDPTINFRVRSFVTRTGFATMAFSRTHVFPAKRLTYVCPIHTPNVEDHREVGIYMRFDNQDYFASSSGGVMAHDTPLAKSFTTEIAQNYVAGGSTFTLTQVTHQSSLSYNLRFGEPSSPYVTTVLPIVFKTLNSAPTCDITIGKGANQIKFSAPVIINSDAIFVKLPPTTHTVAVDYVVYCPDIIYNYPVNRSAVVEARIGGTSKQSWAFVIAP